MKNKKPLKLNFRYFEQSLKFPAAILFLIVFAVILVENIITNFDFAIFSATQWIRFGGGFLLLFFLEILEALLYPKRIYFLLGLLFTGLRIIAVYTITISEPTGLSSAFAGYIFFSMCFYFHPLVVLPVLLIYLYNFYLGSAMNFHIGHLQLGLLYEFSSFILLYLFGIFIRWDDRIRRHNLALSKQLKTYATNSISMGKQEERLRISRDLHDSLGHQLVAANIQLQKAVAYQEINPAESVDAINNAQQTVNQAITELRQTIKDLREYENDSDFITDLEHLLTNAVQNEIDLQYTISGTAQGFPELTLLMLKQIIQEAITNIHKHAQAKTANISVKFSRKMINVDIKDDGIGFNTQKIDQHEHFGLKTMQERVDLVGGKIKINSKVDQGTQIRIQLPKDIYG